MHSNMRWILLWLVSSAMLAGALCGQESGVVESNPGEAPAASVAEEVEGLAGNAAEEARQAVGAVSSTAGVLAADAGSAVREGVGEAGNQGQRAWRDFVLPVWERFVNVLPTALKAFGLLLIFWIAAVILGKAVSKLLGMTDVDQKLARDWGLEKLLEAPEKGRSVETVAGTAVKWIVLLFGFVAFFDTLKLTMVASPLNNILDKVSDVIPALLKAAAILFLYWVVASIIKLASTKALKAVGFDDRASKYIAPTEVKGEMVGPSGMVGRLLFYVVLLFGLPPFLDALGQESIVVPLRDMIAKVLAFIPNLTAAVILLFIGKVVATIVREVVTNFLAATGVDNFASRYGFGKDGTLKLSGMIGSVAFFFTIIPILVAAVDSLKIDAISGPVKNTLEQLMSAVPLIFVAVVLLTIGYYVAKAIRGLVESFLSGVGFDSLPNRFGLKFLNPGEGQPSLSSIAGTIIMAIIMLLTAEQALATLQLSELSALVGGLIGYLPDLVVGLVIILAALSLGNYAAGLVGTMLSGTGHGNLVSSIAKYAIVFLGFSMGLSQLGVGEDIVRVAVSAVLGGAALAMGIAFGLGGRDKAAAFLDRTSDS